MSTITLPYKINRRDRHSYAVASCVCGNTKELSLAHRLPSDVVIKKFADDGWLRTSRTGPLVCPDCLKTTKEAAIPTTIKPMKANDVYIDIHIHLANIKKYGKVVGAPQLKFFLPENFMKVTGLEEEGYEAKDLGCSLKNWSDSAYLTVKIDKRKNSERAIYLQGASGRLLFSISSSKFGWLFVPRENCSIVSGAIYNKLTHTFKFVYAVGELLSAFEAEESERVMAAFKKSQEQSAIQQSLEAETEEPATSESTEEEDVQPLTDEESALLDKELEIKKLVTSLKQTKELLSATITRLRELGCKVEINEAFTSGDVKISVHRSIDVE